MGENNNDDIVMNGPLVDGADMGEPPNPVITVPNGRAPLGSGQQFGLVTTPPTTTGGGVGPETPAAGRL